MMTESQKEKIVERAVMVAADRVDSLVSRPIFHHLEAPQAMKCLKQCLKAALMETEHEHYDVISRTSKKQILINLKLFKDSEPDYDIQLKYSIKDNMR
jgi:hypothetical protein